MPITAEHRLSYLLIGNIEVAARLVCLVAENMYRQEKQTPITTAAYEKPYIWPFNP